MKRRIKSIIIKFIHPNHIPYKNKWGGWAWRSSDRAEEVTKYGLTPPNWAIKPICIAGVWYWTSEA